MIDKLEGFNSQLAALAIRLDKLEAVTAAHTEKFNLLGGDKQRVDAEKLKQEIEADPSKGSKVRPNTYTTNAAKG